MGLNSWWNDEDERKAEEFLRSGTYNDTVRNRIPYSNTNAVPYNQCTSSSQCGYGFACVGGQCVRMDAGSSSGQVNYPGQCDSNDPNSSCNAGGPNSCQSGPTPCGAGQGGSGGCGGGRCCRYGSGSSPFPGVNCYDGDCPPFPNCNTFCEAYLKAHGEPGPGCSEGPDGNSCGACEHCSNDGTCQPLGSSAPCWCGTGNDCAVEDCYVCQVNPEAVNFGACYLKASICQECASIFNHLCPCRVEIDVTACKPYGQDGPIAINLAQAEAARLCDEACNKKDPCKVSSTRVNRCCFPDYGDCTFPSCDSPGTEGSTQVGSSVDENGYGCVTCEFASDLPDSCKDTECNCDNDCPECQLCGGDGKCYTDPTCEPTSKTVSVFYTPTGHTLYCGIAGEVCDALPTETYPQLVWTSGPIDPGVNVEIGTVTYGSSSWSSRCDAECSGLGESCSGPQYRATLTFDGAFANEFTGDKCIYLSFGDGERWTDAVPSWHFEEEYQYD